MSFITTILNKEFCNINTSLNIVWTECTDNNFTIFIKSLDHNLIHFDNLYYSSLHPDLIICNNKMQSYDQCRMFSIQYHIPVLLIDHNIRSNLLDPNKINLLNNFPCVYSIAISKRISESWNNFHNQVLSYDLNKEESKEIWKNLIYQTAKKLFLV